MQKRSLLIKGCTAVFVLGVIGVKTQIVQLSMSQTQSCPPSQVLLADSDPHDEQHDGGLPANSHPLPANDAPLPSQDLDRYPIKAPEPKKDDDK